MRHRMLYLEPIKAFLFKNQQGAVLTVALMFLAILAFLGAAAALLTSTDLRIGGSYKASQRAHYVAEAGAEEARARLCLSFVPSEERIIDNHPTAAQWRAYIGTSTKAQGKGYSSGNAMHQRKSRLQTDMDYTVVIRHQTDDGTPTGNVLYFGDLNGDGNFERHTDSSKGKNIYEITSYGLADGATSVIVTEVAPGPPITAKAALYTGTSANILGTSTNIKGENPPGCGGGPDVYGIGTPQSQASGPIDISGNPTISGAGGDPSISYSEDPVNIPGMVKFLRRMADFSYTVNAATQTGSATPGPGDGWGTPVQGANLQQPSSCADYNVVHYDTGGTHIRLSGGVTGCGVLVVEGDLEVHGNFFWYGVIIVTGSVTFTGGGNKNVTGAVFSGEDTDGDVVGGNANIIYCGAATNGLENHALLILTWKDYEG